MATAMTQYTTELSYAAIAEVVNDEVLIMPMIETKEGVENVEYVPLNHVQTPTPTCRQQNSGIGQDLQRYRAIAAVSGIDALLIGCADLCME